MSTELQERWKAFYREATGHAPFQWQNRVQGHTRGGGVWPEQIVVPTGGGKSSVVYLHAFLTAAAGHGLSAAVPRRMFTVVDRRALVDDQARRGEALDAALREARGSDSIMGWVAEGIDLYSGRTRKGDREGPVMLTTTLRGGTTRQTLWREYPDHVQLICATPAMWGSRALFRGYGTSEAARPQEAAMVATDAVVIVDEAHLAQQVTATARRISQIQGRSPHQITLPLQVVVTTATPSEEAGEATVVGVEPADMEIDTALAVRVAAPKPLTVVTGDASKVPDTLAEQVLAQLDERPVDGPSRPVLCVVNTVNAALAVYKKLDKGATTGKVIMVAGPMRPEDRDAAAREHPYLYDAGNDQDSGVDVVVATQTVEVGVDLDAAALVTELAPASSLAQRLGRVNRIGRRAYGNVVVVVPEKPTGDVLEVPKGLTVYRESDLIAAREWLEGFEGTDRGMSIEAVLESPPAPILPQRPVIERLELNDVAVLERTSAGAVSADPFLDLWISDDLGPETGQIGVVVRDDLPSDSGAAKALLDAEGGPSAREVFAARVWDGQFLSEAITDPAQNKPRAYKVGGETRHTRTSNRVFVLSPTRNGGRYRVLTRKDFADKRSAYQVRPGDTLVIDAVNPVIVTGGVAARSRSFLDLHPATPVATGLRAGTTPAEAMRSERVLTWRFGADTPESVARTLRALETAAGGDKVAARFDAARELAQELDTHLAGMNGLTNTLDYAVQEAHALNISATTGEDDRGGFAWGVVSVSAFMVSEAALSTRTASHSKVTLDAHRFSVGEEAAHIAGVIAPDLVEEARSAGLFHDDGKADPRFQQGRLGNTDPTEALAKSRLSPERLNALSLGDRLPRRWRHEQLSAAMYAASEGGEETDREIVTRMVGTSHGWGRGMFPRSVEVLLSPDTPESVAGSARRLFADGDWEELITSTSGAYGAWGAALAETIVRAADHRISAQGK